MDIFDIDPNALIILVIMVIGGLRWALARMKNRREGDEGQSQTPFQDLYEEARHEIQQRQNRHYPSQDEAREKLGEFGRPLIFEPVSAPPPVPSAPPPIPTRSRAPAYDSSAPPPAVRRTLSLAQQAALQRIQSEGLGARRRSRRSSRNVNVRRLLATPGAARNAIVLREILGPPKGAR